MLNKKILSVILAAAVFSSVVCTAFAETRTYSMGTYDDTLYRLGGYDAGYDPDYICNDTQETKYFFKENFTYTECVGRDTISESGSAPDGWDYSIGGGSLKGTYYTGDYQLIDTSETAPVKISRSFEKADHGKVTLEAQLKIGTNMDGVSLSLYSGSTEAVRLETLGGKMYIDRPGGMDTELFAYTADKFFGLKLEIDIDTQKVTGVYVNGSKVKENLDFGIKKGYLDKFAASTGSKTTGTLSFNMVHMYRGYYLNEKFTSSMQNIPCEFSEKSGVSAITMTSDMRPDIYSLKLDGTSAKAYAKRSFDTASGNLKFSVNVYSETANNMKVSLTSDGAEAIAINIKDGKISCGGAEAKFKKGIWNKLTLETDSDNNTAKLFVNYREAAGSIPYTAESINGVSVETTGDEMITDDYLLEPIYPLPSDYVPAIEKADSDGYYIGMQFCPMWEEGSHSGWDFENSFKEKTTYLGYYDQSSPEAMDWTIKQLAEHGVDFMKVTWMPPYDKNATKSAYIGGTFMDAYFNCEYASQMPFMIMWENSADNNTADEMIKHFAPYWIEYYFKNDNYFKIDGRPVFQIYSPSSFVNCSGGTEACKAAIEQFRQMSIDAGAGDPIVISAYDTTLADTIGCEAAIPYWLGGASDFSDNAYKAAESAESLNITTYPIMGSGIADFGKDAMLTPQEFKAQITDLKNNYYTRYNNAGPLGNMLMLETYDEYTEGHWLAPSAKYGFGYLDAVREVFTSNTAHTDCVPTAAQRDRFNNLYPAGRTVKKFSPKTKGDGSKENLTVKKGWYFDSILNGTEGWNGGNMSSFKRTLSGTIKGTASNADPQITIYDLNLDVTDVTYLKVRYKSTVTDRLQIFFTSDSAASMNELNSLRCSVPNNEWNDLYINVGTLFNFTGTLNSLRIDTGSTAGAEFEIDSIELLSDARLSDYHFPLSNVGTDVWDWDNGATTLSYSNGILTANMTSGGAVYLKEIPDTVSTPFSIYRYVVLKMKTLPKNAGVSILVCGTEWYTEKNRLNNMTRYDDGEYTYCIFDLSPEIVASMQANGALVGDNFKKMRFDPKSTPITYEIADIYITSQNPMPEITEFSIRADSDTICTDEGSVTLTPHIELSNGSEISDISSVTWAVNSVNAAAKINDNNTLTLTGKVNGEVTATAYYTYGNTEYKADYTVTISEQDYRIPSKKIKILAYGNSILGPYPPNENLGWNGNWGMAASAENKDYIHRLMDMFGEKYGRENISWVKGYGCGNFEVDLANGVEGQDWSEYLSELSDCAAAENPDIIIVQYGENTNLGLSGYTGTEAGYRDGLIQFVQELKKGAPDALVLLTTPFWGGSGKINGAKAAAAALNVPIAELAPLTTSENEALDGPDEWATGVKIHPGDKGMLRIAETMYKQLNIALTGNDNVTYSVLPESISITADKTAITENNGTIKLTASVHPGNAADDVVWSTSDDNIASVDENGLVTAIRDGEVTITAVSKYNSSLLGSIKIMVSGQRPFYSVTYNANTTDTVTDMPKTESTKAETLSLDGKYPLRDEYSFVGWSYTKDGEVIDTAEITGDITLYAIWEIADSWMFNRDGYKEGFVIDFGFHQSVANGVLTALETGYTADTAMKIHSPKLNLTAADYSALKIKMQNSGFDENTVITLTIHTSGGDKVFTYPVTTSEFVEYTASLEDISGTITGFDFTPTNMDCKISVDEIYFEKATIFDLVNTTLPTEGKNTSIGYNRYSMTFNKAINTLSLKLGETDITDYTISDDKKTVEFGVNLPTAGSKTLTAAITDSKGIEITLTRTLRVRNDGWVAYTDFDGSNSAEDKSFAYLQNTNMIKMSQKVAHSGNWSIYSTTGFTGDVHTYLQNANWAWTYWNENTDKTTPDSNGNYTYKLTVGEKYKYSYWVYADEGAAVTTPKVLVKKADGNYNWLISSDNYSSLPKQQWNYFEGVFTAETTDLPFFWTMNGNLYIDDIKLEKLSVASELVSTTLPNEGENAPLGYSRYTMMFDKDIDSVTSFKLGETAITDYTVSENTIEFGLRLIAAGDKTLELTIKDADGISTTVSRTITVPDTLVAYADFDGTIPGVNPGHYFDDGSAQASFVTQAGEYHSPGRAALLDVSKQENLKLGNQEYSLLYGNCKLTAGKYYKLSFWAKRVDSTTTPRLAPAHSNKVLNNEQWLKIDSDVMTRYEVTFKAALNEMPWFYGGAHNGSIIIDDILIEETQPLLSVSASKVTSGAKITASLTNNDVPEGVSAAVIIALYKDGRLEEIKITPTSSLARGGTVTTEAVTVPDDISDGDYKVSAFAWNDATVTMFPICKTVTVTE